MEGGGVVIAIRSQPRSIAHLEFPLQESPISVLSLVLGERKSQLRLQLAGLHGSIHREQFFQNDS
ncbi:hypothetical protein [Oryza sativa Japonica Group]|uniref:Uncharacterized protein n=1 Tax=Oryza sativa subsp. japonica TaxID=39947 RepID=Q8LRC4_ORYSJ|nr:hypothetical protein [Oryza sativa Japonica Group]